MFTVLCSHAHSDCQGTGAFLYVLAKSNTWKYIIVRNIKGKPKFKHFYYKHSVEIPNQKGEHSCICTDLSPKRKEEIYVYVKVSGP